MEEEGVAGALFEEPEDYYKPPAEPTFSTYTRKNGEEVKLRLVGSHPLWGHLIWNAAKIISTHFEEHVPLENKFVLELGAGAALPSLVALKLGAQVVVTDYPDEDLMENIEFNVKANTSEEERKRIKITGHLWGSSVLPLLSADTGSSEAAAEPRKFDVVILSDLIFNHSQHQQLLQTCNEALREEGGQVFVSFSHHRPQWAQRDLQFFKQAVQPPFCFDVKHLFSTRVGPMFEEDFGSEDVRSTVHVLVLTRSGSKDRCGSLELPPSTFVPPPSAEAK
ncbi:Protein N-terminal and lysine N-methyltransferase efm7 [Balamuthia mandrillaris]